MTSKSLWMSIAVAPEAVPLQQDERCDVVIVGSGIAGLSTAYELSGRGQSVIVVDRGAIAGSMTARTSVHLAPLCDDLMSEMQKIKGAEQAKLFYESQAAAVDRIEEIVQTEKIDCDFRRLDGYLFQGDGMPADVIDQELNAVRAAGAPVARLVGVPLAGCEDRHVLLYPRQATFHPLKYLAGLVDACSRRKVRLYADTPVDEVVEESGAVTAKTARGNVRAGHAVIATNSPIIDRVALHSKMAPYRTYVIGFAIERGTLPDALYWDTEEPYHYVRQPGDTGTDFVLVGGEDHKSGESDDAGRRFERLEQWARGKMPVLKDVTHRWSGQVLDTIDYAGFIGRNPGSKYIYVSTGDSGQGLTHGVMGAMLNAALITGGESEWAELYAPQRKPLKAAKNWVMENTTAIKNLAGDIAPGEISSVDDLEPGQGAIIRKGLKKIAAYRDNRGELHQHSATCTHLGCHLHWNSFESCWDCPCHGSIFGPDGEVLNAPAQGLNVPRRTGTSGVKRNADSLIAAVAFLAAATLIAYFGPDAHRGAHHEKPQSGENVSSAQALSPGRGRHATEPTHIPLKGWKDILWRTYEQIGEDRLLAVAAGVVFYGLLALFPAVTAVVSSYALFVDPKAINDHMTFLSTFLPEGTFSIVQDQMNRVLSKGDMKLSGAFVLSFALALWSANGGMKAIIDALNVVYDEKEKRGFIKLNAVSLTFTIGGVVAILAAGALVIVVPVALQMLGMDSLEVVPVSGTVWRQG